MSQLDLLQQFSLLVEIDAHRRRVTGVDVNFDWPRHDGDDVVVSDVLTLRLTETPRRLIAVPETIARMRAEDFMMPLSDM